MHRAGLVETEVAADRLHVEILLEEIEALQNVGLLDETRPQDAIPRPLLVDGPLGGIELAYEHLLLVQVTVLLEEDAALTVFAQIHLADNFHPAGGFGRRVEAPLRADAGVILGAVFAHPSRRLGRVTHAPASNVRGVPVVVDIVFVLVGARDAQHHVLLPRFGPRDALGPETRDGEQHLQPTLS